MSEPEYDECDVCHMPYDVGKPHRSERDCMQMIEDAQADLKEAKERVRTFYSSSQ